MSKRRPLLARLLVPALLLVPAAAVAQDPVLPGPLVPDLLDREAAVDTLEADFEQLPPPAVEQEAGIRALLAIYRRMDGLRDVRIHLEEGILEISGTALTSDAKAQAIALAEEVPGVVWVHNRLEIETHLGRRLAPAIDALLEKGIAFLQVLPSILAGLLLVFGSALLAWWVGERTFPFDRLARHSFAQNLLRQAARAVIVLVGLVLALELLDATALVGAVLGTAGILGIAVGFAFRDIVENYLAGVLLSLRQPFAPNDHVQMSGHEGRVIRLTGRETILMTLDGNHVRIPNATVFKAVITNLTRNPRRRFVVEATVAPGEDLARALALAKDAVAAVPGVLESPGPAARVDELRDSSIALKIFGWVDQAAADFGKARSGALRAVKEAFEREGVATPPPEFGVRLLEASSDGVDAPRSRRPARPPAEAPAPTELPDVSPDTTIEDEIRRELATSDEENLLTRAEDRKERPG